MSRIIKLETAAKQRNQLIRNVALALRELMKQSTVDHETRDIGAYIALELEAIDQTIDSTVTAWEKRGYWLKADKFRMTWSWAKTLGNAMRVAVKENDWRKVALLSAQIGERVNHIKIPSKTGLRPWTDAWKRLDTGSPE